MNSEYKDFLFSLQHAAEYGVLNRERRYWHPKKPECGRSGSVVISIGLEYFYPALVVLLIGIVLSLIILGIEIRLYASQKAIDNNHKHPIVVYPFTL